MYKMRLILLCSMLFISIGVLKSQESKSYLTDKNIKKIESLWLLYSANLVAADGSFNRFELDANQKIDSKDLEYLKKYIDSYIQSESYHITISGKGEMEFISFSREQHYVFKIGYVVVEYQGNYSLVVKMSDESEMFAFEITNVNKKVDKITLVHKDNERISSFQFYKVD